MEPTEPRDPAGRSGSGRPVAVTLLLIALLGYLVVSSFASLRSGDGGKANQEARLSLECLYESRVLYGFHAIGISSSNQLRPSLLIANMRKLTAYDDTGDAVRRLAIMQYVMDAGDWRKSLTTLRGLPGAGDATSVDRELATWAEALGSAELSPSRAHVLAAWARSLHLGWYERPVLYAIYSKAGLTAKARAIQGAALTPLLWAVVLAAIVLLALGVGVMLDGVALVYVAKRRFPTWLPRSLWPRSPVATTPSQSAVLYTMFVAYLAAFAGIRFVLPLMLRIAHIDRASMSSEASAVLSTVALLAVVAVPLLVFRILAPVQKLGWRHLGIRGGRVWADVLWGVVGYVMTLPLLLIVSFLSARIFRGVNTPLNPVVVEVVSGGSTLLMALVLLQSAVLAPLIEELMFRGTFYGSLVTRIRPWAAILISSSVFAILHPQLPLGFAAIFVLGAAFNTMYLIRGSLIPSMTAHALNNGMLVIAMVLVLRS